MMRMVYYKSAIHLMIVCFVKNDDKMQMAFIKLHSVCAALCFRTSQTSSGYHQAGTVSLLVSSYTDPTQLNRNEYVHNMSIISIWYSCEQMNETFYVL
jgi:hypothetical protein